MGGSVVLILLTAMAGSWLFRFMLLQVLRRNHPREFAALGEPSSRQLESMLPRHQGLHLRLWRYLWEGKVFLLGDRTVSALAVATLLCDLILVVSLVTLFWSAGVKQEN